MSRPRLSVPSGKASDGGFMRLIGLISFMPCGASAPAKTPREQEQQEHDGAERAERLAANQPDDETGEALARASGGLGSDRGRRRRLVTAVPHPGVEHAVAQVHQEIDQHHADADHEEHAR